MHRLALVELQHEGYVLEQHPARRWSDLLEKPKHLADETRAGTADANRTSSLTEILTRKPTSEQVDGRHRRASQLTDVVLQPDTKALCEHLDRRGFDLAEQLGVVLGVSKPEFDATNAGEEACNPERPPTRSESGSRGTLEVQASLGLRAGQHPPTIA